MSVRVTADQNHIALTAEELAYLERYSTSFDRGGYYGALYEILRGETSVETGDLGVLATAKISTFSGEIGGVAFAANFLLQALNDET